MNANELADKLEQGHWEGGTREQAATMLRQQQEKLTKYELRHVVQRDRIAILEMQHKQQQAEIEALKKEAALQRLSDFTQEADNEPVAWRNLCVGNIGEDSEWIYNEIGQGEPLYTHPAKTLTDEEIEQVRVAIMGTAYWCADENMPEAYNAVKVCCSEVLGILVKAQEK